MSEGVPDKRKEWPFHFRKNKHVLQDIEMAVSLAVNQAIDSSAPWPDQSQLWDVDLEWYLSPTKWIRETAIAVNDVYQCARAWNRYWHRGVGAHELEDLVAVKVGLEWALQGFVDTNPEVSFAMVRWYRTTLHILHMEQMKGRLGDYYLERPGSLGYEDQCSRDKVDAVLINLGMTDDNERRRLMKHFCVLCDGSRRICRSVSEWRRSTRDAEYPNLLVNVWARFFEIYCWMAEMAQASIVLLDEGHFLFSSARD